MLILAPLLYKPRRQSEYLLPGMHQQGDCLENLEKTGLKLVPEPQLHLVRQLVNQGLKKLQKSKKQDAGACFRNALTALDELCGSIKPRSFGDMMFGDTKSTDHHRRLKSSNSSSLLRRFWSKLRTKKNAGRTSPARMRWGRAVFKIYATRMLACDHMHWLNETNSKPATGKSGATNNETTVRHNEAQSTINLEQVSLASPEQSVNVTSYNGGSISSILSLARVPLLDEDECNDYYNDPDVADSRNASAIWSDTSWPLALNEADKTEMKLLCMPMRNRAYNSKATMKLPPTNVLSVVLAQHTADEGERGHVPSISGSTAEKPSTSASIDAFFPSGSPKPESELSALQLLTSLVASETADDASTFDSYYNASQTASTLAGATSSWAIPSENYSFEMELALHSSQREVSASPYTYLSYSYSKFDATMAFDEDANLAIELGWNPNTGAPKASTPNSMTMPVVDSEWLDVDNLSTDDPQYRAWGSSVATTTSPILEGGGDGPWTTTYALDDSTNISFMNDIWSHINDTFDLLEMKNMDDRDSNESMVDEASMLQTKSSSRSAPIMFEAEELRRDNMLVCAVACTQEEQRVLFLQSANMNASDDDSFCTIALDADKQPATPSEK